MHTLPKCAILSPSSHHPLMRHTAGACSMYNIDKTHAFFISLFPFALVFHTSTRFLDSSWSCKPSYGCASAEIEPLERIEISAAIFNKIWCLPNFYYDVASHFCRRWNWQEHVITEGLRKVLSLDFQILHRTGSGRACCFTWKYSTWKAYKCHMQSSTLVKSFITNT